MAEKNSTSSSSSAGLGFCGALTIAFIVLKLCGVIDWSWLWVISPLLLSCGLWITLIAVIGIVALIFHNH